MIYPALSVCGNCSKPYFGAAHLLDLCPECATHMTQEYRQQGTFRGRPLHFSRNVDRLRNLLIVATKNGKRSRTHLAWENSFYQNSPLALKPLCGNRLRDIESTQPFAEDGVIKSYFTHDEMQTRWCTACETKMRKSCLEGNRLHEIVVLLKAGHVLVLAAPPPESRS